MHSSHGGMREPVFGDTSHSETITFDTVAPVTLSSSTSPRLNGTSSFPPSVEVLHDHSLLNTTVSVQGELQRMSRRGRVELASERMGEKLLQGWQMRQDVCMEEACIATPLMRNPSTSQDICVLCNRIYSVEQPETVNSTQRNSSARLSPPLEASSFELYPGNSVQDRGITAEDVRRTEDRRRQTDTASQDIGVLLLQGWTMMA